MPVQEPDRMQAVTIDRHGDNGVVQIKGIPCPVPQAGEVLVKVHAAGVNPVDWKIRNGDAKRFGLEPPLTLGGEMAGTVEAVGPGVTGFKPGDEVYGTTRIGAFAEYVAAKVEGIGAKPAGLDFVHAAAMPLAALTAWQGLFDVGHLGPGQRLLITGASSVVGMLAVQLARNHGATVVGVASGANEALVRGLGVDEFIDYQSQDFAAVARNMNIDLVFDTVGKDSLERAYRVPKKGGAVVTAVDFPPAERAAEYGIRVARVTRQPNPEQLASVSRLIDAGKLRVEIARVLPLESVTEALALSEARHTTGKIVLTVG